MALTWGRPIWRQRTVMRFWTLLWALVNRDVRARFRRSILGPAWAILRPLVMMVVFSVLRGFVDIPSDGIPYPIFVYSVLVPWTFFTTVVNGCAPSIMGNAGILKKMPVPREVFPFAAAVTAGFDLLMSGLVLAGMMLWFRVTVGWSLLWLPLLVVLTMALALAVGMGLTSLGIFKRDFLMAGGYFIQVWMYATPIIYPLSSVPERWRWLYVLNPMVGILEGFRSVLVRGQAPDLALLGWALPGIALALLVAWPLFRVMSQYFADVL